MMAASARPGALRSLLFAAVAGLAAVPWLLLTVPVFGRGWSVALLALGSALAYVAWIAPTPRRAVTAVGVTAFAAAMTALLASPSVAIVVAAALIAVARSVLLFRRSPPRALVVEAVLLTGGLLFARLLFGPSPIDGALAVWGFYLVQSFDGLVGGARPRREEAQGDPFERAQRRLLELMEGGVGSRGG